MEVVWVRQFAPLLGNVVYAFALILASYLLATLAGSLLYRARSASLPAGGPPAGVWMALAVAAMLPAVAADPRLPGVPRFQRPHVARPRARSPWSPSPWRPCPHCSASSRPGSSIAGRAASHDGRARRWALNGLGCIARPAGWRASYCCPLIGERRRSSCSRWSARRHRRAARGAAAWKSAGRRTAWLRPPWPR